MSTEASAKARCTTAFSGLSREALGASGIRRLPGTRERIPDAGLAGLAARRQLPPELRADGATLRPASLAHEAAPSPRALGNQTSACMSTESGRPEETREEIHFPKLLEPLLPPGSLINEEAHVSSERLIRCFPWGVALC